MNSIDKTLIAGTSALLVLSLIEKTDMYGYQMISELALRSDNVFEYKAGTLYPVLHALEEKKYVESYEAQQSAGKTRRYYHITDSGKTYLASKRREWEIYSSAVNSTISSGNTAKTEA